MKHLLDQINSIQKILQDYSVEGAYIFGSRLHGTHNKFSDLDIVIYLESAVKSIKENDLVMKDLYRVGIEAEDYVNLLMNPAISKIKNIVKLDVNIIGESEFNKLNTNVYQNKVAIIENYKSVELHTIEEKIQEVRKSCTPYKKSEQDKDMNVTVNLVHIAEIPRFLNIINNFEKFLNPVEKSLCAIRNEMIKEICLFTLLVDKVDKNYFEIWNINYTQLSILNDIIKKKKVTTGNYNTTALPWINCPESVFSFKELERFWAFIENHEREARTLLRLNDPIFESAKRKFINSINDLNSFLKTYENKYNQVMEPSIFLKEYEHGVDYFMALKGEKKEFLITEDMKKIFNKEVSFPKSFNSCYLFNSNRSQNAIREKILLENACANNFVDVICFDLGKLASKNGKTEFERNDSIWYLKEYPKESTVSLEALDNFISILKKADIEVLLTKDNDTRMVSYARAYVPKWNMVINPTTQNIETFMESLCNEKVIVCIIDYDYYGTNKAYLVKAKKPLIKSYENLKKQQDKEMMEMMKKVQENFDRIFN